MPEARKSAALLLGVLALLAAGAAAAWQARDDEGRSIVLPHPPQRVVSLSPGATAMLFAAGGGARVVGTPDFSVEPEAARAIARIGDSHGFDLERILALHPDLIVAWTGGFSEAQLLPFERAGLAVYRHRVTRLADLPAAIERLGDVLDTRAVAQRSADDLRRRIGALQSRYQRARAPRVLVQVWDRPVYTIGGEQLIDDAVTLCGYDNIYRELHDAAPAVSLESIVARDPEVILAVAADPATSAVRNGRLLSFVDARLSRLGPEVVDATEALCARLASATP